MHRALQLGLVTQSILGTQELYEMMLLAADSEYIKPNEDTSITAVNYHRKSTLQHCLTKQRLRRPKHHLLASSQLSSLIEQKEPICKGSSSSSSTAHSSH